MEEVNGLRPYLARLSEIVQDGFLTHEQEQDLLKRAQEGDEEARDEPILKNGLLVVSIAKEYIGQDVPFEDLISIGNFGLLHAIQCAKSDQARLTTYASIWIRQAIRRYITDQRSIRIPVHMNDAISKTRRQERILENTLGRPPTMEELAEATSFSLVKLKRVLEISETTVTSLDIPVGEADTALQSLIADESPSTEEQVFRSDLRDQIMAVLETLKPREKELVLLCFGFIDGRPKSLKELSEHFGISRERCRQIKEGALIRLRKKSPHLTDYLQ